MQTEVVSVNESFKGFRFNKWADAQSADKCVSQVKRMVNPLLSEQLILLGLIEQSLHLSTITTQTG
jgi:hypothetical protein